MFVQVRLFHSSRCCRSLFSRTMIPEAVFREFPAKTLRKLTVSDLKPPENARNPTQESGNRIRLSVLIDSCRFRAEPNKSGHRICLPEYCVHEISGISRDRPFPCWIVGPGLGFVLRSSFQG